MDRRSFLATAAGALARPLTAAPSKPNIILIMADDLGYECLNCNGGTSYKTPNLDRMAAGGVRFTHAYAQPLCAPTRLQLMTGLYNQRNWQAFGVMDPKETTFGHRMSRLGYKTVIAGKWQLYSYNPPDFEPEWRGKGMHPAQSGFDEHCVWHALHTEDKGSRYGDPTMMVDGQVRKDLKDKYGPDLYSQFIFDFMERNRDKPFFAYYPMTLTHGPFNPTPRSKDWVAKRLKNDRVYFADMVEYMDEIVARVMAKVDSLGLAERTLILFYSDNGTDKSITSRMGDKVVKGGKGLTIDTGVHVPMIASWKGTTPAGRVSGDLIDSADFLPTMLQAAGAPADRKLDGRSFYPQLTGKQGQPREWIYSWYDPRPGWAKAEYSLVRLARDQRWKLYSDGRFYNVQNDEAEQRPIAGGAAGPEGERARAKLKRVIDSYAR